VVNKPILAELGNIFTFLPQQHDWR